MFFNRIKFSVLQIYITFCYHKAAFAHGELMSETSLPLRITRGRVVSWGHIDNKKRNESSEMAGVKEVPRPLEGSQRTKLLSLFHFLSINVLFFSFFTVTCEVSCVALYGAS